MPADRSVPMEAIVPTGQAVPTRVQPIEELAVFSIPMVTRFRGIVEREGILLRGPAGWGEFAPFADYSAPQCRPWLAAAHEAARLGWPVPVRERVPVNITIPALPAEQAAAVVRAERGATTAKVKVAEPGQTEADDIARVEAVRDALGRAGRVRVDANGLWSVEQAVRMVGLLSRFDLEYVEQPCRTVPELAEVRRRVDVPIAADESIRRAEDPLQVARLGAADIAVLKVAPLGGVHACLRIAEQIGLPVVVSSAVDTSVGLAGGLALAAALPELPYACGLGTMSLLSADVVADSLRPLDGAIVVRRPQVDPTLLAAVPAPPERAAWWRARLAATEAAA